MQLSGLVGMYADGLCRTSRRLTSSERSHDPDLSDIADGRINYNGAELCTREPAVLTARNYPDIGRADL